MKAENVRGLLGKLLDAKQAIVWMVQVHSYYSSPSLDRWIIDSGASHCMTAHRDYFCTYQQDSITAALANSSIVKWRHQVPQLLFGFSRLATRCKWHLRPPMIKGHEPQPAATKDGAESEPASASCSRNSSTNCSVPDTLPTMMRTRYSTYSTLFPLNNTLSEQASPTLSLWPSKSCGPDWFRNMKSLLGAALFQARRSCILCGEWKDFERISSLKRLLEEGRPL